MDVSISDAEWQVMNVVWDAQPLTAHDIVLRLQAETNWAPATIKTMLHRLVKKSVLTYEAQGNKYVYRSKTRRSDCVRQAGRSFLERVFAGQPVSLMSHFLRTSKLSPQEIAELRRILKEQEA